MREELLKSEEAEKKLCKPLNWKMSHERQSTVLGEMNLIGHKIMVQAKHESRQDPHLK
jgi:hypothetical protein